MDLHKQKANNDMVRARLLRVEKSLPEIQKQIKDLSETTETFTENEADRLRAILTSAANEKSALEALGPSSNFAEDVPPEFKAKVNDNIQILTGLHERCDQLLTHYNTKLKGIEQDYKHIHTKMDRYTTYARLIHLKVTVDMANMAPNLPDIQRWSTASKELKGQLQKYLEALVEADAYFAGDKQGNKKAHFAIWEKKSEEDRNREIHDLQSLLQLLNGAETQLTRLRDTLQTNQRNYLCAQHTGMTGIEIIKPRDGQTLEDAITERVKRFNRYYNEENPQPGITINATQSFQPGTTTHFIRHEMNINGYAIGVGVVEQSDGKYSKQTLHFNMDEILQIPENSPELQRLAMELVHNARIGCSNGAIKLNNTDLWAENLLNAVATEILYRGYKATLPDGLIAKIKHDDKIEKLRTSYNNIKADDLSKIAAIPNPKSQEDIAKASDLMAKALSTLGSKEINQLANETNTPELYKPGKLPR